MRYIKKVLLFCLILVFLIGFTEVAFAQDQREFDRSMGIWEANIEQASKYLKEAESVFKIGNKSQACILQKKAAMHGIKATRSLIKAFEINGSTDSMSDIESGLNKWRELQEFC